MPSPFTSDSGSVSHHQFEFLIAAAQAHVKNPIEGIFGPNSVFWRVNREAALFLGAGRAALLQLAHPWVAVALEQHSSLLARPITRFHNTFRVVFTMIYGSAPQAFRAARSLYQLHTTIAGELPDHVAGYAKGLPYRALHVPALLWVYATLIDSAVMAYQCVHPPLQEAELNAYYAESKILAGLFGLPPESLPSNWQSFQAYLEEMYASQALGVDDRSRLMAHRLITGAGSWIPIPRWYQALTTSWLPPRFREEFRLTFSSRQELRAQRAQRILPRIYGTLPKIMRYVGPCLEAEARLANRSSGMLIRRSNRFWIGQPRMPFAE